jgi:hypothetical protein
LLRHEPNRACRWPCPASPPSLTSTGCADS